jgi:hypothetical protein
MSDDFAAELSSALAASATEASAAETPAESSAPVETPVQPGAATTQPTGTETATSTTPAKEPGPIPFQAHKTALDNARTKAREEFDAEWKPYEWAKQVDQQKFNEMVDWYQRANADPVVFAQELIQNLQAHPTHGPALRSLAGRALAAARGQQGQQQDQEPQPDIPLEDGRFLYSAEQQARRDAWREQRLLAQFEQKFAPAFKSVEQMQAREAEAQQMRAADSFAGSLYGNLTKMQGFEENKAEIAAFVKNHKFTSDHPAEVEAVALRAYNSIVLPKLLTNANRAVLTQIEQKAQANTVDPSRARTSAPKTMEEMSVSEALSYELSKAAG